MRRIGKKPKKQRDRSIRSLNNENLTLKWRSKVSGKLGEHLKCNNCDAEIEDSSAQKKQMQKKSTAKYEKKIQEHNTWCELKAQECYEAWMSLTATNEQLDNVRMELDNTAFKTLLKVVVTA